MACLICDHCGERTHPETIIRLRRTIAGIRSERAEGWYCWDCKTGGEIATVTAPVPAIRRVPEAAPDARLPEWLIAGLAGLGLRRQRTC